MKQFINILLIAGIFFIVFGSCQEDLFDTSKDEDNENGSSEEDTVKATYQDSLKTFIYTAMERDKWYYWYEKMPKLEPDNFESGQAYFDSLLIEKDKWSYIADKSDFEQHYQEGEYEGLGHTFTVYNKKLWIAFVYDGSPMDKAGVKRGFEVVTINGKTPFEIQEENLWGEIIKNTDNTFEMVDLAGEIVTITVDKAEIDEEPILHKEIYERGDKKIGYIVFQNFIKPADTAITNTFKTFKSKGVTDLILDLRYNGGGQLNIASTLANMIAGNKANDKIFYKTSYNKYHKERNSKILFEEKQNSIEPNSFVVITSGRTASASEAVINGIKPFIETKLVGRKTHGKPVGMDPLDPKQMGLPLGKLLLPITFKGVNDNDYGDYFGGMQPDAPRTDDVTKQFGDTDESCLKEALYYIENGEFSQVTKTLPKPSYKVKMEGLRAEIGAF